MKRVVLSLGLLLALVLSALPVNTAHADPPPSILDAAFTGDVNGSVAFDQCCHFVAQTFTAHTTGALTSIRVEITSTQSWPLLFAIHGVTNGLPDARILGEGRINPTSEEPNIIAYLNRDIPIDPPVYVVAGQQYAMVANYDSNGPNADGSGNWWGATGDQYKEGASFLTNDWTFATWQTWPGFPDLDLHFQTYVLPNVPVSDLSIQLARKPKPAKACQTFTVTYRVTNNGPDTAKDVSLGIGLWDAFEAIAINGTPVGTPHPTFTLTKGQSVLMTATIKVVAFVPGEMRKNLITGIVWSADTSTIPMDPNTANNSVDYMMQLVGRPKSSCP